MPELPEVETVRRVLESRLLGRTITGYAVGRPTFYRRPPSAELARLPGASVEAVRRRGKYLLLALSGGRSLSLHLGMSGRVTLGGPVGGHTRFSLSLGDETLVFDDSRRFGRVACSLPELGPEPLGPEFTEKYLHGALRGRRASIKALLMDQRVVAGLGNIYATEALFLAGIRPGRSGGSVRRADCARLWRAIREVLEKAIERRGSTLQDESFLDPLGNSGSAQEGLSVYGREKGLCGHPLKTTRSRIGGRTSRYCPSCQR